MSLTRLARASIGALLIGLAMVACGASASTSPKIVTTAFSLRPRALKVHVGTELAVRTSRGECSDPTSSNRRVLRPLSASRVGDCAVRTVRFRALRPGHAVIAGQQPCGGTECMAARAFIPVTVQR